MPTILLIDDDTRWAQVLCCHLRAAFPDGTIRIACHGLEALTTVRSLGTTLDLIMLDMYLPALTGQVLGVGLRHMLPRVPILPIIGNRAAVPLLAMMGCAPPIFKPVLPKVVMQAVQETLRWVPPPLPNEPWVQAALDQLHALFELARIQPLLMSYLMPPKETSLTVSVQTLKAALTHLSAALNRSESRHVRQAHTILSRLLGGG